MEMGGSPRGPGHTRKLKKIGTSSQNSPIRVLIFWGSTPYIYVFCLYIFVIKCVSHYDLNVLSM